MKKVLPLIIALCLVLALSLCTLTACESQGNSNVSPSVGLEFTLNDDGKGYSVSGIGTCKDTDIVIPSTYDSKPVTAIGYKAFEDCSRLTSVTILNSVTSISGYAFSGCSGLISVTIPTSVISIGKKAFHNCHKLVEVINMSSINITIGQTGNLTFKDSTGKEWLNGEDHIKSAYVSIDVQNGGYLVVLEFTAEGVSKFAEATTAIKDAPDNKLYIYSGDSIVSSPTVSETINTPQVTITDFENYEDALSIASVINNAINGYSYVNYYALNVKTSGTSDIVRKNGYLFYSHENVNYLLGYVNSDSVLTLPDSYNGENYEIYKYAFYNCSELTSLTFPDSVTLIDDYAFSGCSSLTEIKFSSTIAEWKAITKGKDWNKDLPATQVVCSDGTVDL